jgi:uncharacterized membrane protein
MQQNINQPRIIILLKLIWPTVNRAINSTFYFVVSTIKSIVKSSIDQIKGGF